MAEVQPDKTPPSVPSTRWPALLSAVACVVHTIGRLQAHSSTTRQWGAVPGLKSQGSSASMRRVGGILAVIAALATHDNVTIRISPAASGQGALHHARTLLPMRLHFSYAALHSGPDLDGTGPPLPLPDAISRLRLAQFHLVGDNGGKTGAGRTDSCLLAQTASLAGLRGNTLLKLVSPSGYGWRHPRAWPSISRWRQKQNR
jgi:hypothetical protein